LSNQAKNRTGGQKEKKENALHGGNLGYFGDLALVKLETFFLEATFSDLDSAKKIILNELIHFLLWPHFIFPRKGNLLV